MVYWREESLLRIASINEMNETIKAKHSLDRQCWNFDKTMKLRNKSWLREVERSLNLQRTNGHMP